MPIKIRELDEKMNQTKTLRLLKILQLNSQNAYTVAELSKKMNVPVTSLGSILYNLKRKNEVHHTGKYWYIAKGGKIK